MTAVVVLGAGELGGAVAHALAASDVVRRITLVDDAGDVARGKALDIAQAGPVEPLDAELAGGADPSVAIGAAAIIVADRHGPAGEWSGEEGLQLLARLRALSAAGPGRLRRAPRSSTSSSGRCSNRTPTGGAWSPPPPKRCAARSPP